MPLGASPPATALFLAVSRLSATTPFAAVAQIVQASRRRNFALGMTGALLFDGERFCHVVEGPEAEVQALSWRVAADPRHEGRRLLLELSDVPARWYDRWQSGYCEPGALDLLFGAPLTAAADARIALDQVIAAADLVA